MKLVTPSMIVEKNDSFSKDVLDRKSFGESLLNIVARSDDELVISLDGQWGEGKTTFIKMWSGLLSEEGIPSIYIDAFANDYVDDAFISVTSAITGYIEENVSESSVDKVKEFKKKAKAVGIQLLSWSSKIGVKALTLGVLKESDIEELKDIQNDLVKGASGAIGELVEERLNSHSKDIALLESFKILLSELPDQLSEAKGKPLVIIIDELDRCKPTYAVEYLEKVKHLFSVKHVVFILVTHMRQLEEAIRCVYGQNIDARTYLQKFINLETKIPKRTQSQYDNDYGKYCRKLLELHELQTWGDDQDLLKCIESLANHFNLSLRQMEKVYTNLALFYGSSGERHLRIVPIIAFLAVIKIINPVLFEKLLHSKITYSTIINELKTNMIWNESDTSRDIYGIMKWVKYSLLTKEEYEQLDEQDDLRRYGQTLVHYNVTRESRVLRQILTPISA